MSQTYSTSHYAHIDRVEREHFWFVGRNELIMSLVARFIPHPQKKTFLDIGCGTGVMVKLLGEQGFRTTGLDVNDRALMYAKHHASSAFVRSSIFSYMSRVHFDAAGAFDVMEHVSDDVGFIKKCNSLIAPNGYLFLTVPQGMHLWSSVDIVSGHKRRYSKQSMNALLKNSGFRIVHMGYWNSLLLPFYSIWRYIVGTKQKDLVQNYLVMPNKWINKLLLLILKLEFVMGNKFPFGATLVVVAQKI